jgi:hypothetical protein
MLNEKSKHQDELANIMNALADSVLEMSDEEIKEEIIEEGDNSEAIKQILLSSVKDCRQKKLRDAKERYNKNFFSFQMTKFELPESPDEKRHLIQAMLGNLAAQNQMQVTAQFRDFENLPDEDLDGVLQQIFALQETEK